MSLTITPTINAGSYTTLLNPSTYLSFEVQYVIRELDITTARLATRLVEAEKCLVELSTHIHASQTELRRDIVALHEALCERDSPPPYKKPSCWRALRIRLFRLFHQ